MKKFAIVLSGCGVYDGAEIHESVLTMLTIAEQGGSYALFAPNIEQHHVVNHLTGKETGETRNVLIESARIARGDVSDLKDYDPKKFDAIVFSGGFGAAKNLSSFAFDGSDCTVNADVEKAILSSVEAKIPIGALCIAPAIIARVLKDVKVTIGDESATVEAIEKMGSKHVKTTHGDVIIDEKYNLITTPCYMLDANIEQIYEGAKNVVSTILKIIS